MAEALAHGTGAGCLGVVGLGLMGSVLATRWLEAGGRVVGYDVDGVACAGLVAVGGEVAVGVAEVFRRCDRVVLSLPSDREVEDVLFGPEEVLRSGLLVVDTTTGEPGLREVWGIRLAELGGGYVDATVSGSSEQVRRGEGLWMLGGELNWVGHAEEVVKVFGGRRVRTGVWGSGARMKLVTNLVLGLNRAVLAEGLAFGGALGLGKAEVLEVLRASAAYSRAMDSKGGKMVSGEFDPPEARLLQHLKDVDLICEEAKRNGLALPVCGVHGVLLRLAQERGWGGLDNSVILRVMETLRGDEREGGG